jgi:hypothetical protein
MQSIAYIVQIPDLVVVQWAVLLLQFLMYNKVTKGCTFVRHLMGQLELEVVPSLYPLQVCLYNV